VDNSAPRKGAVVVVAVVAAVVVVAAVQAVAKGRNTGDPIPFSLALESLVKEIVLLAIMHYIPEKTSRGVLNPRAQ